ncbi:hypothetical protein QUC31_002513 [Theobroma cacao]
MAFLNKGGGGDKEDADIPICYVFLDRVYSVASFCVNATNSSYVMSKKVKAHKLIIDNYHHHHLNPQNPLFLHVYARLPKQPLQCVSFYDSLLEDESETVVKSEIDECLSKKMRVGKIELVKLVVNSSVLSELDLPRLRDSRNNNSVNNNVNNNSVKKRRHNSTPSLQLGFTCSTTAKKWVRFFGHWMLIAILAKLLDTMRRLIDIMSASHIFSIFFLSGHAMWPEIVVDESLVGDRKGLSKISGGRSVLV